MFTLTHIADIVEETVRETVEDLENVTSAIRLIAEVAVTVQHALEKKPGIVIDDTLQERSLQVSVLAGAVMLRLKSNIYRP